MSGMVWVKHYTNKRTDPRVKLLPLESKAVYYLLTEVAAQCDAGGAFLMNDIQLTNDQIAHLATVETPILKAALRDMKKTGLISVNGHGPYLTDFAVEQVSQSARQEQWRDRQQRRRDKERDVTPDVTSDKARDVRALELRGESQSLESEALLLLSKGEREKIESGWVAEAITISQKANKPRPSYVAGILKNWIKEGKRDNSNHKQSVRKSTGTGRTPKPLPPASDTDLAAAKRAIAKRKSKL